MTTRQPSVKEIALLLFLLAIVSFVQAEFTYTYLRRIQAWSIAAIFGLVYTFIGGIFWMTTSSSNTR